MSLRVIRCEVCGEFAQSYNVTVPKKNPKQCKKCLSYLESRTETHHFCSWKHLKLWVDQHNVLAVLSPFLKQLQDPEFLERLAEIEHEQWAYWTAYFLNNYDNIDNRNRWRKQIGTLYSELSDKEKESDRKWARKVLGEFDRVLKEATTNE